MLKLLLAVLVLFGTCAAQSTPNPLSELQGTARVLIVFTPDPNSADFKRQLLLIERHVFELTERNTVVVAVPLSSTGFEEHYIGENLPLVDSAEQANARTRFHVQPSDFLVILLNQDGTEQIRSSIPVDIHSLTARLDGLPKS